MKSKSVNQLCPTFCDPMDYSLQAPLSMGFPRREYGSELPFLRPRDLPDPGMEHGSPALQNSLKIRRLLWAFPHHLAPVGNPGCCSPCILLTWMWGRGPQFPWCYVAPQAPKPPAEDFSPWITDTLPRAAPGSRVTFMVCTAGHSTETRASEGPCM